MSLLDAANEDVVVYPEEVVTDQDGNTKTRPSKTGIPARARLQVQGQSGTSARLAEQDVAGFESEKVYTVRFPRSFTAEHGILGAQSQIEWGCTSRCTQPCPGLGPGHNGQRWAVFGDANRYNGSRRTQHVEYVIRRS